MKLSLPKIFSVLVLLSAAEGQAQLKSGSLIGNCRSLALGEATGLWPGFGTVNNLFTTYDGTSGFPLNQPIGPGVGLFSQELRPRAGQPGVYEADYITYDSSGSYIEYGSITASLPTTDSDGNGLPDVTQKDKALNTSTTGSGASDYPVVDFFIGSGNFSRSANSQVGNYSMTVTSASGSVSYTGSWGVLYLSGNISYQRGSQNTLNFNLTSTDPFSGASIGLTGSTTFTVNSANQIAIPQFSLAGTNNKTYTINASTLNRVGNRYIGNLQLIDGNSSTSWPDYTNWVVEITDTNDSDGNGIPDLSDALPVSPSVVTHPQSQTVGIGANVRFTVAATGTPTPTYQWQFNGANISGGFSSSYTRTNAQPSDAGEYKVRVSNSAGSVESAGATLTVQYAPVITSQPRNQAVIAGNAATFSVTANGVPSLAYQWRLNNQDLANATASTLTLSNINAANIGNYLVIVSNAVGSVPSSVATLSIPAPPTNAYVEVIRADGPAAYWRLGESSRVTAEDEIGANDGTYLNGVSLAVPGIIANDTNTAARFFSADRQKIDVPWSGVLNPPQFTAEVWARVTGTVADYRSPLTSRAESPQRGYMFYAEPGNTWQFWSGKGDTSGWDNIPGPGVEVNKWTHLVATYDGTIKRFYVNGVEVGSSTAAFGVNGQNVLRIGGGATDADGNYFFEGDVDEPAIYNKALTQEQIVVHYLAGTAKLLRFDGIVVLTNGDVLLNLSGPTGKDMTILGSPDLLNWLSIATLPNPQGTVQFTNTSSGSFNSRFYKATAE